MRTVRHLQVVTSEGKTLENNCHYRSSGLRRVDDAGLTDVQKTFLQLLGHLCESLSSEIEHGRRAAQELAESSLGEADGSELLGCTTDLLKAIQTERCGNFAYMPTECPVCSGFLSEEECITLDLLQSATHGDEAALVRQAQIMTAGGSAHETTSAAIALGYLLSRLANKQIQSSHARSAQSVSLPLRSYD